MGFYVSNDGAVTARRGQALQDPPETIIVTEEWLTSIDQNAREAQQLCETGGYTGFYGRVHDTVRLVPELTALLRKLLNENVERSESPLQEDSR
jgi:hypothetical protein